MKCTLKTGVAGLLAALALALAWAPAWAEGYMGAPPNTDSSAEHRVDRPHELSGWARAFFFQGRDVAPRAPEPEEQHYLQMHPQCQAGQPAGSNAGDRLARQRCVWKGYQP